MNNNKISLSLFPIVVESIISRNTKNTQINEISNAILNKTGAKLTLANIKTIAAT